MSPEVASVLAIDVAFVTLNYCVIVVVIVIIVVYIAAFLLTSIIKLLS